MDQPRIWGIGSYFSQIWRSAFNDSVPFYPLWYNQFLNRKLPVVIDTNNLMLVYASVPVLRTVIDQKANLMQNARFKIVSIDDETKEFNDDPVLELIHKPNALQNKNDFIAQWSVMRDVYATALIYKNKLSSKGFPKTLWVLPTGEMKINPTGLLFEQFKIEDIIKNYEHINNQYPSAAPRFFEPSEIIRYVDGPTDRYYFGISKIVTNKLLISNLQQSLTTRNVLMADMGARGILSNQNQDAMPIGDSERSEIQKDYHKKYGNADNQERIIITNANLKWQAINFPTKDLMAFEEVEDCFCHIIAMYGLMREIFPNSSVAKGSTPIGGDGKGKQEEALKITYETTIQQTCDEFCKGFNEDEDFGLQARRRKLIADFKHLPVMQEDQINTETIKVKRTDEFIKLNTAVALRQMTREAAIYILETIYGIDASSAKNIIGEPIEQGQPEQSDPKLTEDQKQLIVKYFNL